MNNIKVSVIIPSYNCEQYLCRCLDSVIDQTLTGIEIIIIDDGSTDASQSILDEYRSSDDRIHAILQKENKGVSTARNMGIDTAIGEYIIFLDADDHWLDNGMLENLYGLAVMDKADIVSFRLRIMDGNGDIKETAAEKPRFVDLLKSNDWGIKYSPVTNLISRGLINQSNIRFCPDLIMGEDALFCCELYCYASRLTITDKVYYNYLMNPDSANNSRWSSQKLFCTVQWFEKAIQVITNSPAHTRRPNLLQNIIAERLRMLTQRLAAMAVAILDEDELRRYIETWDRCLHHIDREYFDTQVFPNGWPDPPRILMEVVMAGDLPRLRGLFQKY